MMCQTWQKELFANLPPPVDATIDDPVHLDARARPCTGWTRALHRCQHPDISGNVAFDLPSRLEAHKLQLQSSMPHTKVHEAVANIFRHLQHFRSGIPNPFGSWYTLAYFDHDRKICCIFPPALAGCSTCAPICRTKLCAFKQMLPGIHSELSCIDICQEKLPDSDAFWQRNSTCSLPHGCDLKHDPNLSL